IFNTRSVIPSFASGPAFVMYARATNPWDGVPVIGPTMSTLLPPGQFSVSAVVDGSKNWAFDMSAQASGFAGMSTTKLDIQASSLLQKLHIDAHAKAPFDLANVALDGNVDLTNGAFHATQSTSFNFDIQTSVFSFQVVSASEELSVDYSGVSSGQLAINFNIGGSVPAPSFHAPAGPTANH